jgi:hypothetical protein
MRTPSIMVILLCCGSMATAALAREPISAAPPGGEAQVDIHQAIDLRLEMARMQLKAGRNTLYTNEQGRTLQAVANRRGVITGYVSVDAAGKVSKINAQSKLSAVPGPGEQALVHKCLVVTQECLNNPLPRSGNPEDCILEVECPKTGSFSNLLTR